MKSNRKGQGLVEYALIVGLVSLFGIACLSMMGFNTTEAIGNLSDAMSGLPDAPDTCHGATLTQHLQHCPCSSAPHTCKSIGWSC